MLINKYIYLYIVYVYPIILLQTSVNARHDTYIISSINKSRWDVYLIEIRMHFIIDSDHKQIECIFLCMISMKQLSMVDEKEKEFFTHQQRYILSIDFLFIIFESKKYLSGILSFIIQHRLLRSFQCQTERKKTGT